MHFFCDLLGLSSYLELLLMLLLLVLLSRGISLGRVL